MLQGRFLGGGETMFLLFGECGRDVGNCFLGGGGMQGVVIFGDFAFGKF